eukprot:66094_1
MLSLNYTTTYLFIRLFLSCFVGYYFSSIIYSVYKQKLLNKNENKDYSMVVLAVCLWTMIIIHSMLQLLFSTNLIIPFPLRFGDMHCSIVGIINLIIISQFQFFTKLFFLEAVKQAFINPKMIYFWFMRIILAGQAILFIFTQISSGNFAMHPITYSTIGYVCVFDPSTSSTFLSIFGGLTWIIIGFSFIWKAYKLVLSSSSNNNKEKREMIVSMNFKHCMIILIILIAVIIIQIIRVKWIYPGSIPPLMAGLSVLFIFPFGNDTFHFFFGRCHRYLLNSWIKKHGNHEGIQLQTVHI